MILLKQPFFWSSAHRETKFTFDFPAIVLNGSTSFLLEESSTGKMTFLYTGITFSPAPVAGEYLYVDSGIYKGYHRVTGFATVSGFNAAYTDTDFIANQTSGNVKHITSHVFEVYIGYQTGALSSLLPYTKIAEFRSEANVDGLLEVNISGYLKRIFDVVNSNDLTTFGGQTVLYNLFNQYTLILDGAIQFVGNTLNSSLTMFELNRDYVDTGLSLNSMDFQNYFRSCGEDTQIEIVGGLVQVGTVYTNGIPSVPPWIVAPCFAY